jgi:hypothetical protein
MNTNAARTKVGPHRLEHEDDRNLHGEEPPQVPSQECQGLTPHAEMGFRQTVRHEQVNQEVEGEHHVSESLQAQANRADELVVRGRRRKHPRNQQQQGRPRRGQQDCQNQGSDGEQETVHLDLPRLF